MEGLGLAVELWYKRIYVRSVGMGNRAINPWMTKQIYWSFKTKFAQMPNSKELTTHSSKLQMKLSAHRAVGQCAVKERERMGTQQILTKHKLVEGKRERANARDMRAHPSQLRGTPSDVAVHGSAGGHSSEWRRKERLGRGTEVVGAGGLLGQCRGWHGRSRPST